MYKKSAAMTVLTIVLGLALILAVVVYAQGPDTKPYQEGSGGQGAGSSVPDDSDKAYQEGAGSEGAGSSVPDDSRRQYQEGAGADAAGSYTPDDPTKPYQEGGQRARMPEGAAGASGVGRLDPTGIVANGDLTILYRFSGASDDGEQGSASRREATSVHCTNIGTDSAQVEVQVYQWNGTNVYTGTVNIPANRTYTFSTQNTTIYFDDVILGGSPGTDAIFQGSGRVLTSHSQVICTAQVLDPLNYPPDFVVALDMFKE